MNRAGRAGKDQQREEGLKRLRRGDLVGALVLFRAVLERSPDDLEILQSATDASLGLGDLRGARLFRLRQVECLIRAGRALEATTIVVRLVQSSAPDGERGARLLAAACARRTGRAAALTARAPRSKASAPAAAPPLLGALSRNAFLAVVERMEVHTLHPDEVLYAAGTRGDRLYWVVSGEIRLESPGREEPPRPFVPGEVFGQWTLLREEVREAAARAGGTTVLLSLSRGAVGALHSRFPSIRSVVEKFCRTSLLKNLLWGSPLFGPFPEGVKRQLMSKMELRRLPPRTLIWEEGCCPDGFYLLLEGRVEIFLRRARRRRILSELERGATFGEMSLLDRKTLSAGVKTVKKTVLFRLSRKGFTEVIAACPAFFEHLESQRVAGVLAGRDRPERCFTAALGGEGRA